MKMLGPDVILERERQRSIPIIQRLAVAHIVGGFILGVTSGLTEGPTGGWLFTIAVLQVVIGFPLTLGITLWFHLKSVLEECRTNKLHHHFLAVPDLPKPFYLYYLRAIIKPFYDRVYFAYYIGIISFDSWFFTKELSEGKGFFEAFGGSIIMLMPSCALGMFSSWLCQLTLAVAWGGSANLGKDSHFLLQESISLQQDKNDLDAEAWELAPGDRAATSWANLLKSWLARYCGRIVGIFSVVFTSLLIILLMIYFDKNKYINSKTKEFFMIVILIMIIPLMSIGICFAARAVLRRLFPNIPELFQ
jgi:hypothetical protein